MGTGREVRVQTLPTPNSTPARIFLLSGKIEINSVLISLTMPETKPERRNNNRVPTQAPVTVHSKDGRIQTTGIARDLSDSGIFFYTSEEILPGNELEMVLLLPAELTQGEKRWVCCQASVVRVEKGTEPGKFGLAASITNMQALPEIAG